MNDLTRRPWWAPATTAAPTNLDQAIQAATNELVEWSGNPEPTCAEAARIAVEAAAPILTADAQALRDKVADLDVYAAQLHDLLRELHERGPTRALHAKIDIALAVQPPQHRRQLLGYQTSDGRLYRPEDITLVYALNQGETARDGDRR